MSVSTFGPIEKWWRVDTKILLGGGCYLEQLLVIRYGWSDIECLMTLLQHVIGPQDQQGGVHSRLLLFELGININPHAQISFLHQVQIVIMNVEHWMWLLIQGRFVLIRTLIDPVKLFCCSNFLPFLFHTPDVVLHFGTLLVHACLGLLPKLFPTGG